MPKAVKSETPKTVTPSAVFLSCDSLAAAILADLRKPASSKFMIGGMDNGSAACCCALTTDDSWDGPVDVPSFSYVRLFDEEHPATFMSLSNETLFEDVCDDFSPSEGCTRGVPTEEDSRTKLNSLS